MEERKRVRRFAKKKAKLVDEMGFDSRFMYMHLIEEMAELTQAISKIKRFPKDEKRISNLYEEVADVFIGVNEIMALLDKELLNQFIDHKLSKKQKYLDKWEEEEVGRKRRSQDTAS